MTNNRIAATESPVTPSRADCESIAIAFWQSGDGALAVLHGGRLDRYLPPFLFAGQSPRFEFTSDEAVRAFYEDGPYNAIRDAVLDTWPEAQG